MAISVKLEVFEGPLDLLLHLIDKNKIDIYDIPITLITEQYLDYIRQMESEDMNVMSEFLVMAATLLDIKCRMLLPVEASIMIADGAVISGPAARAGRKLSAKITPTSSKEIQSANRRHFLLPLSVFSLYLCFPMK